MAYVTGTIATNPYNYRKFGLREVKIIRDGITIESFDTTNGIEIYKKTLDNLHFTNESHGITYEEYDNKFIMVFDLTSTNESNVEVYYPELTGGSIRLELRFDIGLKEVTQLIVTAEKLSTVQIAESGKVSKHG